MRNILPLFLALLCANILSAQTTIVTYGSSWKYLDNGSNQNTAWRSTSFNDASWGAGNAQLGYGDGDEATIVSYGPRANKKYITTYFRKTISVSNPSQYSGFTLNVKRDDGAVVYINGVERFRTNMPTGSISYTTKASGDAVDEGNTPQTQSVSTGSLVNGTNVIAVEVHQSSGTSTDLSFDLELIANAPDITPPTVSTYSPADNATGVATSANLVLTFNENIQKGTGNIVVKEGGVTTQTISVTSAAVTVSGNTATIDPANFSNSAAVNIEIAAGAFKDLANNNYAGITDATTWNFTVQALPTGPQTLVAFGASWKYLDNGSNQGTAWRATAFNDAGWATGNAQLGYGDGDEATVVSFGPDANNKYITTYFRKTISVSDPSAFTTIAGSVKRDDGIAIYVNGTEVYRNNLAAGAGFTTLATLADDDGGTAQLFNFSPSAFVSGNNVIAVEIHQNAGSSTDISFDLELVGTTGGTAPALTRGPYLQMGSETAITIRWRTATSSNSRVEIGTTPGGSNVTTVSDAANVTEHEMRVTGLSADTKYYYSIGTSTATIQGDANNYFQTAPSANTTRKIRIAAFGDCGTNSLNYQSGTLTAYRTYLTNNGLEAADAWLLLGDNAYSNGTETEFSSNFFNPYGGTILKNHKLYPAPGNHDYAQSSTRQADHNVPYFSIFTLPANAECGGVASTNERYYSYDIGNIHFLSLDSYGKENNGTTRMYDTLGAQVTWIKQDLAANTKPWVIAYWHHPPYTMGSHNSDTESELVNIRQNFIRILERLGVDVILCGHSHDYERSYLLNGYYGNELSFNVGAHTKSSSSGKYDGSANSCPYTTVAGANHGTVYVLSGSSGASGGTQSGYPHNAMPWSINDGGMTYIEVEGNRLDQKFIRKDGTIWDRFTIMKNVNKTTDTSVTAGSTVILTASWSAGAYSWSTGATTRSITVSPTANTTYTVSDGVSCVTDVFNINVAGGEGARVSGNSSIAEVPAAELKWDIAPTLVHRGQPVRINTGFAATVEVSVVDINGRLMQAQKIKATGFIQTDKLPIGAYFIKMNTTQKVTAKKLVVMQ